MGLANHTAALDVNYTMHLCGLNDKYQLGNGTTTNSSILTPLENHENKTWKMVACGSYHTVAIDTDDKLWAWGSNDYGQLGDGTTTKKSKPTPIGDKTWKMVACGYSHTVAIDTDDKLWACGYNNYGQLGAGTTTNKSKPTPIGENDWLGGWHEPFESKKLYHLLKKDGTIYTIKDSAIENIGVIDDATIIDVFKTKGFLTLSASDCQLIASQINKCKVLQAQL